MLENGATSIIPTILNMEILGETIICDFNYDTEKFPQYQTISIIIFFKEGNLCFLKSTKLSLIGFM